MKSAIYEGRVRHRRTSPVAHEFSYSLYMLYLDLSELEQVFAGRWLWSTSRPAAYQFRRSDHFGDPSLDLADTVRSTVLAKTGRVPTGPIRLLTQLRTFGYCFNPVSFYYCFDADDRSVDTIVAEVSNTPWGERHIYVLESDRFTTRSNVKRFALRKEFHVSPFLPMEIDYDWRFGVPGENISVHMSCAMRSAPVFDATLALERRPITGRSLAVTAARHPAMSLKIIGAIYWQALRLWSKRTPVYDHPDTIPTKPYPNL